MASIDRNRPVQYRAMAQEARDKAASESNESTRKTLLHDAELWDRMADYEEKIRSLGFQSYHPRGTEAPRKSN